MDFGRQRKDLSISSGEEERVSYFIVGKYASLTIDTDMELQSACTMWCSVKHVLSFFVGAVAMILGRNIVADVSTCFA